MSIAYGSWAGGPKFFTVFYSDFDPDNLGASPESELICAGCLVNDGDVQLARGLDRALENGGQQVDYDPETGEWFTPSCIRRDRTADPAG
jgi:hypothetical protein